MWRNTLCQPEIDPGRGGTHSDDRKSTWDVVEYTFSYLPDEPYARDTQAQGTCALRFFSKTVSYASPNLSMIGVKIGQRKKLWSLKSFKVKSGFDNSRESSILIVF